MSGWCTCKCCVDVLPLMDSFLNCTYQFRLVHFGTSNLSICDRFSAALNLSLCLSSSSSSFYLLKELDVNNFISERIFISLRHIESFDLKVISYDFLVKKFHAALKSYYWLKLLKKIQTISYQSLSFIMEIVVFKSVSWIGSLILAAVSSVLHIKC